MEKTHFVGKGKTYFSRVSYVCVLQWFTLSHCGNLDNNNRWYDAAISGEFGSSGYELVFIWWRSESNSRDESNQFPIQAQS